MPEALATRPAPKTDDYVIDGWDSRAVKPGLSKGALRRARLIAEGLFSEEGPVPKDRLDWLETDLGDFFGHVSRRARLIFWATCAAVYYLAPLTAGRFRTLGSLEWHERVHAIEAFEKTPLSLALLGCKAILSIVYFEHPDAAAEIGWDQECMKP